MLKSGGSAVIGPDATVIAGAAQGDSATLTASIDPEVVVKGRLYLETAGHYSRPDIFELNVDMRERPGLKFNI